MQASLLVWCSKNYFSQLYLCVKIWQIWFSWFS